MATQGPNSAGTATNVDYDSGAAWTNLSNISASDNTYVTCTLTASGKSDTLLATNFGFSIPTGSTINSILVEVEVKHTGSPAFPSDESVLLTKNGSATVGNDGVTYEAHTTSDAYYSFDSDVFSDPLWGTTWTAAEINASTFGVFYREYTDGAGYDTGNVISIDDIRITVDYTPPPADLLMPPSRRFQQLLAGGH